MTDQPAPADARLAEIAGAEWAFRRRHTVRELGAHVPLRGELPRLDTKTQADKLAYWSRVLAELDALEAGALSEAAREDLLVLRQQVEALHDAQRFRDEERPFNAFTSFWDDTAAAIREETFLDETTYLKAIGLMRDIPRYFDEAMTAMRAGLARGFTQPAVVLPAVIRTIEAVAARAPEETDYFRPFRSMPERIPPDRRDGLRDEALGVIADLVLPAHARLLTFMRETYLPHATTAIAASALPDGRAYYEAKVRAFTTLPVTPEAVFDLGLAEVEVCRAEMTAAMRASGFTGELPDFLAFLKTDPRFRPASAEDLLMRAAWIARRIEGRLDRFFGLLPRRRFAIEPVPDTIAPTYPMGTGAPGLYLINTHDLASRPLYLLPVLTLHEAVPGHCFQMSLAAENTGRPAFRAETYGIAYGNAWALYCEKRLGVEMGIYETPYELFGMWSLLTLRAVRMVVDVGIHAKGWSFDRALAYMAETTSLPMPVVEAELRRYISWPGQALGYYLGMLTIERLRARAEAALGADFDLRAFHDRILALGPVPMTVLEQSIEHMISQTPRREGPTTTSR